MRIQKGPSGRTRIVVESLEARQAATEQALAELQDQAAKQDSGFKPVHDFRKPK